MAPDRDRELPKRKSALIGTSTTVGIPLIAFVVYLLTPRSGPLLTPDGLHYSRSLCFLSTNQW
jgi:hypothetical protein